jgi:hypothetical protein
MDSAQAIPGLLEAARAFFDSSQPGEHTITFNRAEHDKIIAELAALKKEPGMAQDLVEIIYPGAIPDAAIFYAPLLQFAEYLDFTDQANEIVGIVWGQWARQNRRTDASDTSTPLCLSVWVMVS